MLLKTGFVFSTIGFSFGLLTVISGQHVLADTVDSSKTTIEMPGGGTKCW